MGRWQILRRNPRKPSLPAAVIKTVCGDGGAFAPLDRRTINWLYSADLERKYARKQAGTMADLVIRDLDKIQSDADREKEKRFNDQMAEAHDRTLFEFRRLEKKGITGKASFWR